MEKLTNTGIEFSREIPGREAIAEIVACYKSNRNQLQQRADEFGLSTDFITNQGATLIGPFVSPAPLPTTYGGNVENFRTSLNTQAKISEELQAQGFSITPALTVVIQMSEIPVSKGPDALIAPKTDQVNQKLSIPGKVERGVPYGSVTLTIENVGDVIQKLSGTFNQYLQRFPELKKGKYGWKILETVIEDIAQTTNTTLGTQDSRYLNFASVLNGQIASRVDQEKAPITTIPVDSRYYSPLLKFGVSDISAFTKAIGNVGFFSEEPNFIKIIGQDKRVKFLKVVDIGQSDILLQFNNSDEVVRYSALVKTTEIAPCKELSYFLCFGSFVPVIYGSENSGDRKSV